jgi:TonB family protein
VEAVTSVLLDRAREPGGLRSMVGVSLALHAGFIAFLVLMPAWRLQSRSETPEAVMTITLGGGAPGPVSGGANPIGGRPVQTTEPADSRRPEAVRPPAAKAPEMAMPAPNTKAAKKPSTDVKKAPDEARGRTPTRGTEAREGSAVAETGARGMGWGLSTGGGGGTGSYLDVSGTFCCPEYVSAMLALITKNWAEKQQVLGSTMTKFTILRNGAITDVQVEQSSGYVALDLAAQRALLLTRQLPPLPAEYTEDHLTVHLRFEYTKK